MDSLDYGDIVPGEGVRFSLGCAHAGTEATASRLLSDMLKAGTQIQCPLCPPGHGLITSSYLKAAVLASMLTTAEAIHALVFSFDPYYDTYFIAS